MDLLTVVATVAPNYDLSSVHTILSGAAPLDGGVAATVAAPLGCRVRQGYGMTEMSPVSHVVPLNRDDIPLASVGITLPNMECKLIDITTEREIPFPETGVSEPGELLCRGPNIMVGYLGNEEATAQTLEADGILHTGDVATVSAEGYVTVIDRLKGLIKYKGYQVAPAELEAVLVGHPLVADAAVISGHDTDGEEVPKAFVVLQPGADLTADQIMHYVADRGRTAQEGQAGRHGRQHPQVVLGKDPAQGPARGRTRHGQLGVTASVTRGQITEDIPGA